MEMNNTEARRAFFHYKFGSRILNASQRDKFLSGNDSALHPSDLAEWQAFLEGVKYWQSVEDARFNNV